MSDREQLEAIWAKPGVTFPNNIAGHTPTEGGLTPIRGRVAQLAAPPKVEWPDRGPRRPALKAGKVAGEGFL